METNASGFALGVVIMQEYEDEIHPIAFHFRSLLPTEKNYNAYDKELTSVVFRFKYSCPYFLGTQYLIIIHTDHKNLQYFRKSHKMNEQQARWFKFL